mmetsp:Transcript_87244/g.224696  ORF Transcript_87244/g.224696 Transcript_87244/m.224696 type:complete len:210 (+) Transcript_87244:237-866(+)
MASKDTMLPMQRGSKSRGTMKASRPKMACNSLLSTKLKPWLSCTTLPLKRPKSMTSAASCCASGELPSMNAALCTKTFPELLRSTVKVTTSPTSWSAMTILCATTCSSPITCSSGALTKPLLTVLKYWSCKIFSSVPVNRRPVIPGMSAALFGGVGSAAVAVRACGVPCGLRQTLKRSVSPGEQEAMASAGASTSLSGRGRAISPKVSF